MDVGVCGRDNEIDYLESLSHSSIVSEGSPRLLFKAQQRYLLLYMY